MSEPPTPPLLIVISAPSGGGKTTLCQKLLASDPHMTRAITCTTRAPRPGEEHGVDYYFFSEAEFDRRLQAGEFLEDAQVFGHHYGTLKSEVLDRLRAGADVLLNIDVQGASTIRSKARTVPEIHRALCTIFLTVPSLEVLARRLRKRAQDQPDVIEARLKVARQEFAHWRDFEYVIISGTADEDLSRAQAILQAEKMRCTRVTPPEI